MNSISKLNLVFQDELLFEDVRLSLQKYSLIQLNEVSKSLNIHRLLQSTIRESLSKEDRNEWHQQITDMFNELMLTKALAPLEYRNKSELISHIHSLMDHYDDSKFNLNFMILLNNTGEHLTKFARYSEAEFILQFVLRRISKIAEENQKTTAVIFINLGFLYKSENKYEIASTYYTKALEVLEQNEFSNTKIFATALMNLGRLEMELGYYVQSHDKLLRALTLAEQLEHDDSTDICHFLNNYGLICDYLKIKNAHRYYIKVLKILKFNDQLNTSTAALAYNNLSVIFNLRKKFSWSISILQKSIEIDRGFLGDKHPTLAYRYQNISDAYYITKNYTEAMRYLRLAYKIRRKYFKLDHPDIGIIFLKYGDILERKNLLSEGKKWIKRSLKIDEQFYQDHNHIELEPALCRLSVIQMKLIEKLKEQSVIDLDQLEEFCIEGKGYVRRSLNILESKEKYILLKYYKDVECYIRKTKIEIIRNKILN